MNTYRPLVLLVLAVFAIGCGDGNAERDSTCAAPTTDCDGTCRDLRTDPASCGACGTTCDADQVCAAGACVATCPSGTTACHSSCVDTATDVTNCGTCGTVCSTARGAATCVAGTCGFAACDEGSYGSEGACHTCTTIAGCATESCTTAFDAACLACAPGTYLQGNSCIPCSGACAAGSYQTAACSATADRTCDSCTAIAGCNGVTCTSASDSSCAACPSGSYLGETGCVACSGACAVGSYETAACSATADRTCGTCAAIAGCTGVACTSATDSICTACPSGSYLGATGCVACSGACAVGSYQTAACSATTDRTCGTCTAIAGCTGVACTSAVDSTCTACPSGDYLAADGCHACSTTSCPAGTYETAGCTATADRTCAACTAISGCTDEVCSTGADATCHACAPGTYLSGNACVACSTDACPTGTYETTACSATADRTCGCTAIANCTAEVCSTATDQTCTTCGSGHYIAGGACAACSACRPGEIEEAACGGSSDTTCAALDCYALHVANPALGDGIYKIDPDGLGGADPFDAYCDMTSSGGGWTLLMKVDGSLTTFTYDSPLWTNATPYQPAACALDEVSETKSAGFATMPFNAMRVGMFDFTDANARWLQVAQVNSSLLELFTSGYQALAEGRDAWKSLLANASLQPYCNMEGFNVDGAYNVAARIGIVSNQENDCGSPDSRIGIGTKGDNCGQDMNHSSGDEARCNPDNGDVSIATFGYVMVRNCPSGVCECGGSLTSCGALCIDTDSDAQHCGSCGNVCGPQPNAAGACAAGACGLTCNPGWGDCDNTVSTGCEADLSWDAANCGACGNTCASGLSCIAAACVDASALQIDNPNHRVVEYLPRNPHSRSNPAEGTCNGDCTVHPTVGWYGVRIRSSAGFASGCNDIESGQCYVQLPAHVVVN